MSGCLLEFLSEFPALLTEESEMGNANILIIEDDEDIREGIRILLESEDYQITEGSRRAGKDYGFCQMIRIW